MANNLDLLIFAGGGGFSFPLVSGQSSGSRSLERPEWAGDLGGYSDHRLACRFWKCSLGCCDWASSTPFLPQRRSPGLTVE